MVMRSIRICNGVSSETGPDKAWDGAGSVGRPGVSGREVKMRQTPTECRRGVGSTAVVPGPYTGLIDPDREFRDRLVGRCAQRSAVAHIELGSVQHALDRG